MILALDASTANIGWCIGDGDKYVASGTYQPRGFDVWQKITNVKICFLKQWLYKSRYDVFVYEYPSGNRGNMHSNLVLGGLMYACIEEFRTYYWVTYNKAKQDAPVVIVRPKQVTATGVYKGQLREASFVTGKEFVQITKKDGTLNKAAMDRQNDEIDAIGVWLAGLKILQENRNG